jgi:hypothetical protein
MSNSNTIERLKELGEHYAECLRLFEESRDKRLTAEMRRALNTIRKETLNEMLTLIKRLD